MSLAQLTSLLVLIIFTLVNASLIVIKRRHRDHGGYIAVVGAALPRRGTLPGTVVFQVFNR